MLTRTVYAKYELNGIFLESITANRNAYNPNEQLDKAGIEAWGSGILLEYRESLYFITCDHNLHLLDDYSNGERANLDFNVAIITNDRN